MLDKSALFLYSVCFDLVCFFKEFVGVDVGMFVELAFSMCFVFIRWQWWRWWSSVQDWQFHITLRVPAKRYFEGKGEPVFPPLFNACAHFDFFVARWAVKLMIVWISSLFL